MARTVGFFHNGSQGTFDVNFATLTDEMNRLARQKDADVKSRFAADERSKSTNQHLDDLVAENPKLLIAAGGPPAALAAKAATAKSQTPVVFTSVADPVGLGLVKSLKKPGGNMTGVAGLTSELDIARLQLLNELLGKSGAKIGVLNNANRPMLQTQFADLQAEANRLKVTLVRQDVTDVSGMETAIKGFKNSVDGILVTADSLFNNHRKDVVKFADGMPAIYQWREFAEAGGFMSFGPSLSEAYRQAGELAARILNGESPADIPVQFPTRFELVINIDVVAARKFPVPGMLLARAEIVRTAA
jgi:putative ABC transport system substrate-binding protein